MLVRWGLIESMSRFWCIFFFVNEGFPISRRQAWEQLGLNPWDVYTILSGMSLQQT